VRILTEAALGGWDSHLAQSLQSEQAGGVPVELSMHTHRLDDLVFNRQDRVKRGHGVLEDHGNAAAADLAQLALGQSDELARVQPDAARNHRPRSREQPQDGT
jgi:hypothetical protein